MTEPDNPELPLKHDKCHICSLWPLATGEKKVKDKQFPEMKHHPGCRFAQKEYK